MTTLAHYKDKRKEVKCWVCSIPEAKSINTAIRGNEALTTIAAWLCEARGYNERGLEHGQVYERLRRHTRNRHQLAEV